MLTYKESLNILFQLERLGMKFGLAGITKLLKSLSNPHRKFHSVHIAGTNGKGSTASMLAAILTSAGYRTGLYTSPHLVAFEERIRIDGKPIPKSAVASQTGKIKRYLRAHSPTFFEATTAMAFSYFAEEEVDIAVVETGLGGRLDSTNVLRPLVSVITRIAFDHTDLLGASLAEIAYEKAGIIKRGRPCVTGVNEHEALTVIRRVASERSAPLTVVGSYSINVHKAGLGGSLIDFKLGKAVMEKMTLSLPGAYQYGNLAVALATTRELRRSSGLDIPEDAERSGLSNVQSLTGLAGRLSVVANNPRVIIDVAHNPDAVRALVATLAELKITNLITVFGVLRDKEFLPMCRDLAGVSAEVVAVAPRSDRARSASDVAAAFQQAGVPVKASLSVEEGIQVALERAGARGTVLVTGSHYVVGEALKALGRKRT